MDFPTKSPCITALTIEERMPVILALRRLMVNWMDCPDVIKQSVWCRSFEQDESNARTLESRVLSNYCDTF